MSIFTSISNFIGGLFSGGSSHQTNTATVLNGLDYSGNRQAMDQYGGTRSNAGASGSWGTPTAPLQNPTYGAPTGSWTPPSRISAPPANAYQTHSGQSGSLSAGMTQDPAQQYRFDKTAGTNYMKGANVGNLDITGKTQQEADQIIQEKKAGQMSQTTANSTAQFTPEAISKTDKLFKEFKLSVDNIQNEPWSSTGTKRDKVNNLLQATSTEIVNTYDTPKAFGNALQSNPELQAGVDTFIKNGGTPNDILTKFNEKNVSTTGNNMPTPEFLNKVKDDTAVVNNMVPSDVLTQNRIAQVSKIPDDAKKAYFGDANTGGLIEQRINVAKENVTLLERKIANEEKNLRNRANLEIQKNNEELAIAKDTVEKNRLNAKNYMTAQLAKLGALNTTSAAVEAVTILDQKYQQQSSTLERKVNLANREIEIRLQDSINQIESRGQEAIQSVKEDLSKDMKDMQKEIAKLQHDSDKEVYNLSMKLNSQMKKNNLNYSTTAEANASQYTKDFLALVSPDFGGTGQYSPISIAANLKSNIPKADQQISVSARIKDPTAINYFKSLPKGFKDEWIQFASTSGDGRYFTLADLKQNFEAYQVDKNVPSVSTKKVTTSTGRSI